MIPDNRSPLIKRLAEIMPKKPETPHKATDMMHIEMHPIRMTAESFASYMGDDLPADREELRAMLWTFGEILNGHMERMLNDSHRRMHDLLDVMPFTSQLIPMDDLNALTVRLKDSTTLPVIVGKHMYAPFIEKEKA
jgi:hypothetical protein